VGFSLLGWYLTGYMPGTYFRDQDGVRYGTGWAYYYYESGEVMLEEKYVAGKGQYSRLLRYRRFCNSRGHVPARP